MTIERDDSEERRGIYRLRVTLNVTGALTDAQRQELLNVAGKCPVHKLMTQATTEGLTNPTRAVRGVGRVAHSVAAAAVPAANGTARHRATGLPGSA